MSGRADVYFRRDKKGNVKEVVCRVDEGDPDRGELEVGNGFDHPRVLIADFELAWRTLQLYCCQALGRPRWLCAWWPWRFGVVFHPVQAYEGGLTSPELRTIREVCDMAGASRVHLCFAESPLSLDGVERAVAEAG